MHLKTIVSAAMIAILSACGAVDFAERTDTVSRTLTVREIDQAARSFVVTGDGQRFILRVSDAVVNFDQIEVGDKLNIDFVESVAVAMAEPEDEGETLVLDATVTAPEGAKPGIAGADLVSTVVEFVSYDSASKIAVVRTQDGDLFSTKVSRELRRFAASRMAGDKIIVDIATGIAVRIEPAA